jgi:DNA polymerase-1
MTDDAPDLPVNRDSHEATGKPAHQTAVRLAAIPADINNLDRLAAARFYADTLGWAVHPLNGPDKGDEKARGKKPLLRGWTQHRVADITPEFLQSYFGNGSSNNLGCVVRPPFIHIDLDSKRDRGKSVEEWMAGMPELANVPRERTGGGVHLVFICRDLPEEIRAAKKAPTVAINDAVSAELYKDGLNIVLSPSVHPNGHRYVWEVTGTIPEVRWADIARWFGFGVEEPKRRGRPPKEKPWWSKWREDLRTLDLVKVMETLGRLGECVDADESKWSVACPWEHEHSGEKRGVGTDTVIFNKPETMPSFRCLHSHCEARDIRELVEWAEERQSGIIAANCTDLRVWEPGGKNREGRPRIVLPGTGRAHGVFGLEIGAATAPQLDLFRFGNSIVEIAVVPVSTSEGAIPGHMLNALTPTSLITAIERSVETGVVVTDDAGDQVFLPKSMSDHDSRVISVSQHFTGCLPRITRVLDVPTPLLDRDGKLIYPETGYDERFGTWLNPKAPKLRTMGLNEALDILTNELFSTPEKGGFWWHDEQARIHALARLVTPFCRGLMNWRRPPLWIYDGNREGCGKDTCADITHVLYSGRSIICAPLSKDCDEEMRKRITSALMAGSRFFHLANMKGHIRYASLEAATDNSGVWEDRRLGVSETLRLPNETEFSFSANNATWEPDIERRCRRIRLRFTPEDINGHRYRHLDIRGWVLNRRADLLSAINALVLAWVRAGMPPGPSSFTSFPEWGVTIGGIFMVCGLADPCLPHEESNSSGDQNTRAMRRLFELSFDNYGDSEVRKQEYNAWAQSNEDVQELFDWLDLASRRGMTSFGKLMAKFEGRELGGITFRSKHSSKNRATYQFFREGGQTAPELSLMSPGADSGRGHGDIGGHSSLACIGEEKSHECEIKHDELKGVYNRGREKSPNVTMSPLGVFCSIRPDLDRVALDLKDASRIALDIETYGERKGDGLDPWKGDIRLLSVCRHGGPIWTIDLRAIGYELGPLKPILEEAGIIIHNAKFDLLWLRVKCGLMPKRVHCTLTAARLLVAGTKPGNNLDQCLERYLGIAPAADHSRSDWASMLLTDDQLAYAARDVAHLHDLLGTMESELEASGLDLVWALESNLLPCVISMEATGIHTDKFKLESIATEADRLAKNAADDLRTALGNPSLNPASPSQVLAALRGAGIKLESTAEEILKASDDGHLVPLVLAHRETSKRAQQAESLVGHIQKDGRIHGRFEPLGTATGRFSSKEPNLQNIGRGEMREAFTAPEGKCLIVADYSQIELRAAAAIAGETKMIDAYKAGADLHKLTAATVLGKPETDVTKSDRQLAKAVNFGLLYGQSAPGLVKYAATSYGVTLDEDQAFEIRTTFFRTYSRLRQWHGTSHNQAEEGVTEVRTRTGRRRLIPEKASEWERFTALVNTPVQGGTADGMKHALILIHERLPKSARIVSTVHDEVVVECREESAEECREIITTAMVEAMAALFPEVPVEVEANICTTWAEK